MRVEDLAPEFGVLLAEELEGRYPPAQIRAMRLTHEEKILGSLRTAYGPEISDTQAVPELWRHLIDLQRQFPKHTTHVLSKARSD